MNQTEEIGEYHLYNFGDTHIILFEQYASAGLNHMYAFGDFEGLIEVEASDDKWFAVHPLEGSFDVVVTQPVNEVQKALDDLYNRLVEKNLMKDFVYKVAQKKLNTALELMKHV